MKKTSNSKKELKSKGLQSKTVLKPKKNLPKLRIKTPLFPGLFLEIVALHDGLFEKEGMDVEFTL